MTTIVITKKFVATDSKATLLNTELQGKRLATLEGYLQTPGLPTIHRDVCSRYLNSEFTTIAADGIDCSKGKCFDISHHGFTFPKIGKVKYITMAGYIDALPEIIHLIKMVDGNADKMARETDELFYGILNDVEHQPTFDVHALISQIALIGDKGMMLLTWCINGGVDMISRSWGSFGDRVIVLGSGALYVPTLTKEDKRRLVNAFLDGGTEELVYDQFPIARNKVAIAAMIKAIANEDEYTNGDIHFTDLA